MSYEDRRNNVRQATWFPVRVWNYKLAVEFEDPDPDLLALVQDDA